MSQPCASHVPSPLSVLPGGESCDKDCGRSPTNVGQRCGGPQQDMCRVFHILCQLRQLCEWTVWVWLCVQVCHLTSRLYGSLPSSQAPGCLHLLQKDVFILLVNFLLGPTPKTSTSSDFTQKDKLPRRWSSNQVREFGPLHSTISVLVRSTDFSMFEADSDTDEKQVNPYMIPPKMSDLRSPSDSMHQALFTFDSSKRFIREVGVLVKCENVVKGHLFFFLFFFFFPSLSSLPPFFVG